MGLLLHIFPFFKLYMMIKSYNWVFVFLFVFLSVFCPSSLNSEAKGQLIIFLFLVSAILFTVDKIHLLSFLHPPSLRRTRERRRPSSLFQNKERPIDRMIAAPSFSLSLTIFSFSVRLTRLLFIHLSIFFLILMV